MRNIFVAFAIIAFFTASCGSKPDSAEIKAVLDTLKEIPADQIVAASDTDQYGFQTGVVFYTSTTMGITQNVTMWFNDFGRLVCSEITSEMLGQSSSNLSIVNDSMMYNVDMIGKEGTWQRRENDTTVEPNYRILSEEKMKELNLKKFPDETVLGKKCTVFEMTNTVKGMEVTAKVWVWEGIPLKSVSTVSGIEVKLEATDVKVNIIIPKSKFEVPAGIKMTEESITDSLSV